VSVAVTTAVILAAGQGTRLREHVADYPKGFLRIGERPIVEESVLRLAAHGITRVVIVTGYAAGYYEELARARAPLVETVHNAEFAASGSMYSLYCARALVREPFLLLESDLVYEPRALVELLDHPADDAILLSGPTGAGDEVYVEARDGRLVGMSKDRARLGPEVAGELVGISKISAALFGVMQRIAATAFARSLKFDYETDCFVAAARERAIACPAVGGDRRPGAPAARARAALSADRPPRHRAGRRRCAAGRMIGQSAAPSRPGSSWRGFMRNRWSVMCWLLVSLVTVSPDASAYLDPSTGSMILSAIVGMFATAALALKTFWYRIRNMFRGGKDEAPRKSQPGEAQRPAARAD
jgi:2-aminoethylphosphonate-pyruvate transaminase